MKRHPFLLLEVLIATALIGAFSYVSLEGLFRTLSIYKGMVASLEYKRVVDLERMEIVKKYWNLAEELAHAEKSKKEYALSKTEFEVSCKSHSEGNFLLTIHELRVKEFGSKKQKKYQYHYLVSR